MTEFKSAQGDLLFVRLFINDRISQQWAFCPVDLIGLFSYIIAPDDDIVFSSRPVTADGPRYL